MRCLLRLRYASSPFLESQLPGVNEYPEAAGRSRAPRTALPDSKQAPTMLDVNISRALIATSNMQPEANRGESRGSGGQNRHGRLGEVSKETKQNWEDDGE